MKRDLLAINDFSQKEVLDLLDKSTDLKAKRQKGIEYLPLKEEADGKKDYSGFLIHLAFNRRAK